MSNAKDDDVAAMGARIGRRLAEAKSSTAQPAVAIRLFVEALVAQHPAVKLPELVADSEVGQWLAARAMSEGHLRQALTEARKLQRSKHEEQVVRRSPRAKARIAEMTKSVSRSAVDLAVGAVPNRSIGDL